MNEDSAPNNASKKIKKYFDSLDKNLNRAYSICSKARKQGFDPEDKIEITLANSMAQRVEGIISVIEPGIKNSGISKRIKELEEEYGKLSWRVACVISLETAHEKFHKFESKLKAMETGIRVGLAYLTLGVVASPIEGFVELKLKKTRHGKEYFCLMFSGPIRSAGGTAAAVSVIVADYIRNQMGYAAYDPTEAEIKRGVTELYDYHERITNLQYLPSEKEIDFMCRSLPIQIDGDPSEKIEVSNYKDLDRIETNIIRNGYCLVIGESLCQKAAKLLKELSIWGNEFGLDDWNFIKEFVKLQKSIKSKKKEKKSDSIITADYTFIKDLVAGRPILAHPLKNGGFRLRYGRSRTTGLSSAAIHPALTYILDKYIAIGTQLKLERPGKATSLSICDSIEGPLVKLKDDSVIRVNNIATAKKIAPNVSEIIYLGDILINYGDFFNRAHPLIPAGYCEEWWAQEVDNSKKNNLRSGEFVELDDERLSQILTEKTPSSITVNEAILVSKKYNVPLHPKFTFYWNSIEKDELVKTITYLKNAKIYQDEGIINKLVAPLDKENKRNIEILGIPHSLASKEYIIIEKDYAIILHKIISSFSMDSKSKIENLNSCLDTINSFFEIQQRDRGGIFIGARMGRPEKAKVRKMTGQPHCLFPVGAEGGKLRSFQSALLEKKITSDFQLYLCECNNKTVFKVCEKCGKRTKPLIYCIECKKLYEAKCPSHKTIKNFSNTSIDINSIFSNLVTSLNLSTYPDLIKGVKGTSNKDHEVEHLSKGILRSLYNVPVNKDGTIRYDMTQLAITHFKPKEIGTSIKKLNELGYYTDKNGEELINNNQIVELFPQDLILPKCEGATDEGANAILYRASKFLDSLLVKNYGLPGYYNCKTTEDLTGSLVVALAPHTSAGILGRIIGFSQTQGFYAHPLFHAATRRDCDGDEASVTLLVDAFLNFSKHFLPNTRGATQDAPLVLTSHLNPSEVDDMAFDIDVAWKYPLEFYNSALAYKMPWKIKVEQELSRLNTPHQYENFGFTHEVSDLNAAVTCSAYKLLPSMQEKLQGQMELAVKIRAVSESDVAQAVIEKHFIKDIKGNLRKFSQQQFRCTNCNEKYRRPPLMGKCTQCAGNVIFTISQGSIVKYLEPALSLAKHYNLSPYLMQTLLLTKNRVESVFGKDKEKQEGLGKWFG